jgi:phosphoglycolate phosphatase-like HAD superfamily hydrolase
MKIVLDADGVLLDYNKQMAKMYELTFGVILKEVEKAHHFSRAYGVVLTKEDLAKIYTHFDVKGWATMPAVEGSVQATQLMHSEGHDLSCLSSMPSRFVEARRENFVFLNMPIDHVIGSGRDEKTAINPKAQHLIELNPDIFVDDQLRNFDDVPDSICRVLIDNGFSDSPNVGKENTADFTFKSLLEFSQALSANPAMFNKKKKTFHI